MNRELLKKLAKEYVEKYKIHPGQFETVLQERRSMAKFYGQYTEKDIMAMTPEDVYEYLHGLWAMMMWGNKHYVVDKIITKSGLENFRVQLAYFVRGQDPIVQRWDKFRSSVKGMGPAMMSEILCKTKPREYAIWNRSVLNGLGYLGISKLPKYDYQIDGKFYERLCLTCKQIGKEIEAAGMPDIDLLGVDYFLWEMDGAMIPQGSGNGENEGEQSDPTSVPPGEAVFIHNEIRSKLRDIGEWLGFVAKEEQTVAAGSKVDTIWEVKIGNMGRVIYVFEVQTKGSLDSLMMNLLKSLNNPAVQGIVAVSDQVQIEKIKKHAEGVKDLTEKLKYWDYEEVIKTHESLQFVNQNINKIGLVPESFYG
ncbi:MAG: hypothetical protein AB7V04_08245 [Desulfomonilaceae bacterium]